MFYVDLEPAENNKEIYNLRFLNNQVIKIEAPHRKFTIVQCTRCQQYNHTKTYCTLPYACVKCGGAHDTKICTKSRDVPAKCALCKGTHPANYRGCEIYKKLQKKLRPRALAQERVTEQKISENTTHNYYQNSNRSYSQVVQGDNAHQQAEQLTLSKFLEEFKAMFIQLMHQNNMVMNMLSTLINKLAN